AEASAGTGTARPPGRQRRVRGSRRCARPPPALRPIAAGAAPTRAPIRPARDRQRWLRPQPGSRDRLQRPRSWADVAGIRPEEPTGALLLEDVRRPACDTRAREHRRRERRRDLGDVEHDRGVVLDVRSQDALRVTLLQGLQRDLLELLGDLDLRRAELLGLWF